jgi:hypothetical protein
MQSRTTARINIAFTAGNGDGRLVAYKSGTTNTEVPVDGKVYAAGDLIDEAKVIAVGNVTTATTGDVLTNGTWYTFCAFEYSGTAVPNYNTTLTTNVNRKSIKTLPKEFAEGETYVIGEQLAMGGINPNPVNGEGFVLDVYTPESGDVVLEIVSVDGSVVYSNTANLGQGSHFIKLSLDNEKGNSPSGTYFVKITGFGETIQQKFIYMP